MKIEKTRSRNNQRGQEKEEESYDHQNDVEYCYNKIMYRNNERLARCLSHPEDLDLDNVVGMTEILLKINFDIPSEDMEKLRPELRERILPELMKKTFDNVEKEAASLETFMKNIDWTVIDGYRFVMKDYIDADNLRNLLHLHFTQPGYGLIRVVPETMYILVDTLRNLKTKGGDPLEINMDALLPYVKYRLMMRMHEGYFACEQIIGEVLEDYIRHLMTKASEYAGVRTVLIERI